MYNFINISKVSNHIFIEDIPIFNDDNSNQQLRFITLIDILYEKKVKLSLSMEKDLDNLGDISTLADPSVVKSLIAGRS